MIVDDKKPKEIFQTLHFKCYCVICLQLTYCIFVLIDYGLTKWNEHQMICHFSIKSGCLCCSTEFLKHEIIISSFFWQQPINLCSGEDTILTQNWDVAINCTITCIMKVLFNEVSLISDLLALFWRYSYR